ncbi:MAG: hypothetical protein IJA34_07610 [Lachnospiraceae bacterium]|nr:hypothetical protein [Lachnospiraceae bacterium]
MADSCLHKLKELNCETDEMLNLLEKELECMTKTNTVYHFLLLKDIAELSDVHHYPIIVEGNIHYSIIAYLLGIVNNNPIEYEFSMYPDCVWGNSKSTRKPDFSIRISQQVRLSIGRILND